MDVDQTGASSLQQSTAINQSELEGRQDFRSGAMNANQSTEQSDMGQVIDEDDIPLGQLVLQNQSKTTEGTDQMEGDGDSDDDVPLGELMKKQNLTPGQAGDDKMNVSDDESEDDVPLGQLLQQKQCEKEKQAAASAKKRGTAAKSSNRRGVTLESSEEESSSEDDDEDAEPRAKRQRRSSSKSQSQSKSKSKQDKAPKAPKWNTLVHNGVIFPELYVPHGVKMLYDGKAVDLTPEQEEVATMYAGMLETDYVQKPDISKIFNANFWQDWKEILGKKHIIQDLSKCDFTPIYEHLQMLKEEKKQLTKEQKQKIKEDKEAMEAKYKIAVVDGREEQVGNFRVEPPGLFRGRGVHPKMGKLKARIFPEDITLNLGSDAPIPPPPPGRSWKEVRHDDTVTWLAFWKDPVNPKEYKYVFLGATSQFKTESDREKYEKARRLKDFIQPIREKYTKEFKSSNVRTRQMATALYFIDRLALRAGHEKEEDEADTVGCCTLKVENVFCLDEKGAGNKPQIKFDFLGKDSIRYENCVEVEEQVFENVKHFMQVDQHGTRKQDSDQLFDTFDANDLNQELKDLMEGLSVKVFRTYNASILLDDMLRKMILDQDGTTVNDRKVRYDDANREVAILCNHQRSVPKTHGASMERIEQRLEKLKEELDLLEEELKLAKRGCRMEGKKLRSPDAIQKSIERKIEAIRNVEVNRSARDANKTVALGTSKINYLDPRITVAWCKRNEVPITKVFNKTLLQKFSWAMSVEPDFSF